MPTARPEFALAYPTDEALGDLKAWMVGEKREPRGLVERVAARFCIVQLELELGMSELEELPGPRIREPTVIIPGQRQTLTEKLTHATYQELETAETIKDNLELKVTTELGTKLAASGALGTEMLARLAKSAEFSWRLGSELKKTLEAARSRRHLLRFDITREFTISNEFAPGRERKIEVTPFRYARHVRFSLDLKRVNVLDLSTSRSQLKSLRLLGTTDKPVARLLAWNVVGDTEIGRLDVFVPSNHGDFYARVAHLGEDDWDRAAYTPKIAKLPRTELDVRNVEALEIELVPCRPREELLERLEAVALDAQAIAQAPTESIEKAKKRELELERKARSERISKLRKSRASQKKPAAKKPSQKKKPVRAERKRTAKKKKTAKRATKKPARKSAKSARKLPD